MRQDGAHFISVNLHKSISDFLLHLMFVFEFEKQHEFALCDLCMLSSTPLVSAP